MNTRIRFFIALALMVFLIFFGIVGYMSIEDWSFIDSIYMTFITLTTVGFTEVRPLSEAGRYFTIIFLVIGIGTAGFAITTLFGFIFEGAMMRAVKERRMELFRKKMKGHYIICGYGDVGKEVGLELTKHGVRYAVIDKNPACIEQVQDKSAVFLTGDATEDDVLERARIGEAEGLVACLADDASNVFITLTARQLNPNLKILAKATDENAAKKMRKAGADRVVSPDQIAGRRIAASILRPQVVNFLDVVVDSGDVSLRIEEFSIPETSHLAGKTLRDANIGQSTGAIILAIIGPDGHTRYNPSDQISLAGVALKPGDVLIAMGSDEQLQSLNQFMETHSRTGHKL